MKKFLFILFLIVVSICNSQTVTTDGFEIKYLKSHKVPYFQLNTDQLSLNYDRKKEHMLKVKLKVTSLGKRKVFDPNKFYFIEEKNKLRIRPSDIKRTAGVVSMVNFGLLVPKDINNKPSFITYDPSIKDTFNDYKIDGYLDIDKEYKFGYPGAKNDYETSTVYFRTDEIKKKDVAVFIITPNNIKELSLYYGGKKVVDFIITK